MSAPQASTAHPSAKQKPITSCPKHYSTVSPQPTPTKSTPTTENPHAPTPNGFLSRTLDQPSRSPLHPLWTTSNFRAATNATKALKKRPSAARKRIMNTGSPQLTDLGVYRIDHEDRNPTFLVALKNT